MLSPEELHRYSRQILLPGFGKEGQEKLKNSSVLVVGAGGLGSPVLLYLAAAGVGRIGIVEFDKVDVSNLQRQVLFGTQDVGKPKVATSAARLRKINSLCKIQEHAVQINSTNAHDILSSYDVVVDGSDNLPTRYLVNDACVLLNKPLIYGAIFQFEGQVSVFNQLLSDHTRGPNYRDLFPEPPPPEMVPSCSEGGVLGVLPGIIGSMMANEAIKIIAEMGETLCGRLLLFNSLDFITRVVNIRKSQSNPLNHSHFQLIDYEVFCDPLKKDSVREIEPVELKQWMDARKEFQLVDVRDPQEIAIVKLESTSIPMSRLDEHQQLIRRDIPVVIYCKSGGRSAKAVQKLESGFGLKNTLSLRGGILAWINQIDPSLPRY